MRTQSPTRSRFPNITRSEFWFTDGNIVLITGSTAFKVHRGQLERHSEVFYDLFSIPQPADQELYDGCPWIELYDSPFDLYYFLVALYDGLYFKKPHANDFPSTASVLRLSSKYLVPHLRERCLARLSFDWPSTLAGWDRRERLATDAHGRYAPRESCAHPILVIALAFELSLPALLPAAFYDLCRYGPSKIASGTPVPHPPRVVPPSPHEPASTSISVMHLSHNLLYCTFQGREHAQRYVASFIAHELAVRNPAPGCTNRMDDGGRACYESFYFIMLNVLRAVGGIACGRDADPLYTLVQAADMLSRVDFSDGERECGLGMCSVCKLDFYASVKKAREEAWGLMTEWFTLEKRVVRKEGEVHELCVA